MSTEEDILFNIYRIMDVFLLKINEAKRIIGNNGITNIKENVRNLDNNYFFEDKHKIYGKFLNLFDNNGVIDELIEELLNYKNIIENNLDNICFHEWINDEIDICDEKMQQISYCKKCQISKKN